MNDIISFESLKQQLIADKLTSRLMQDARIQKQLHDIYNFQSTNSYKLFLAALFYENHKILQGHNSRTGFLVGFDSDHIASICERVKSALDGIGREYLIVEANGKCFADCVTSLTGKDYHVNYDAFVDLKEMLLSASKVVVLRNSQKVKYELGGKSAQWQEASSKSLMTPTFQMSGHFQI